MSELGGRHASAHHGARPLPHTSEVGGRRAGPRAMAFAFPHRAMARPIAYITCTVAWGLRCPGRRRDILDIYRANRM